MLYNRIGMLQDIRHPDSVPMRDRQDRENDHGSFRGSMRQNTAGKYPGLQPRRRPSHPAVWGQWTSSAQVKAAYSCASARDLHTVPF